MTGGEIAHGLVFDGHQIAADGPIVGAQCDSLGGGFEGSAAGEMLQGVVAEQAEAGDVGAGGERRRDVVRAADDAGFHDGIHGRGVGCLERRLAAKGVLRFVGGTVGDDDGVFQSLWFGRTMVTVVKFIFVSFVTGFFSRDKNLTKFEFVERNELKG